MAKKRREEVRQKNRKKQQQLYLIIGIVVAVIGAIAVALYLLSQSAPIPDGVAEAYADMEQGADASGFPRLGSPNAPITVVEYASFGCPHCKDLSEGEMHDLYEYVAAGHVQIIFKPISTIANDSSNNAGKSARAAVCAMEQNRFWEMHDIVFHWQGRYGVNGSRLDAANEALGMDQDQFNDCYNGSAANNLIALSEQEFTSRGFNSTPRILVNNQEVGAGAVVSAVETQMEQLGLGG